VRSLVAALVLLAALQLADIATTAVALNTRAAAEANQAAAALMASYGQPVAYLTKTVGVALVMLAVWRYRRRRWAPAVVAVALALSTFAVVNNLAFLLSGHP
jgi:Domain of unknown function (DUF5658)